MAKYRDDVHAALPAAEREAAVAVVQKCVEPWRLREPLTGSALVQEFCGVLVFEVMLHVRAARGHRKDSNVSRWFRVEKGHVVLDKPYRTRREAVAAAVGDRVDIREARLKLYPRGRQNADLLVSAVEGNTLTLRTDDGSEFQAAAVDVEIVTRATGAP